jgi:hypothetical protein
MSNTIELLEAIGRDASLRHATSEALANILEQSQASDALTAAVASGDSSLLAAELGHKVNFDPQASQTDFEDDAPDQEKSDAPDAPSPADESNK